MTAQYLRGVPTLYLELNEALARERGLNHPFSYINYGSQIQDPLAGYGAENLARLVEVSKKYDPNGVL